MRSLRLSGKRMRRPDERGHDNAPFELVTG